MRHRALFAVESFGEVEPVEDDGLTQDEISEEETAELMDIADEDIELPNEDELAGAHEGIEAADMATDEIAQTMNVIEGAENGVDDATVQMVGVIMESIRERLGASKKTIPAFSLESHPVKNRSISLEASFVETVKAIFERLIEMLKKIGSMVSDFILGIDRHFIAMEKHLDTLEKNIPSTGSLGMKNLENAGSVARVYGYAGTVTADTIIQSIKNTARIYDNQNVVKGTLDATVTFFKDPQQMSEEKLSAVYSEIQTMLTKLVQGAGTFKTSTKVSDAIFRKGTNSSNTTLVGPLVGGTVLVSSVDKNQAARNKNTHGEYGFTKITSVTYDLEPIEVENPEGIEVEAMNPNQLKNYIQILKIAIKGLRKSIGDRKDTQRVMSDLQDAIKVAMKGMSGDLPTNSEKVMTNQGHIKLSDYTKVMSVISQSMVKAMKLLNLDLPRKSITGVRAAVHYADLCAKALGVEPSAEA